YESVHEMGMKPYAFAYLYQASDLRDQRRTGLFQKVSEAWNEISEMLTFFLLEIMELPEAFLESLANHDALLNYRHFLLRQFQWKPYTLSEPEEKIIKRKNLSGRKVFVSLYDELMGSLSFPVEIEGQRRSLSTDQVLSLLHSPDRSLRENAYQTLLEELGRQSIFFKNILNALVLDHHLENLKRGHPSPMHRVCLSDGVDDTAIETMMEVVERHYPLAQRYFHLKARFLGLEKLRNTDLLAPLTKEGIQIPFSRAKRLVLEAIENLHPLIYSIGCEFFERKWIDAEMRKGKRGGAFCKCFAPFLHPFLSINYGGSLRDVMTLAHELGHGIHYRLAAKQSYLN
ncbi:MAG: oligoendopeptidase F, partial [Deltaproteobacteria bacterium]